MRAETAGCKAGFARKMKLWQRPVSLNYTPMRRQHPARKTPRSSKSAGGKKQRSRLKTRLLRVSTALLATACLLALALPLLIKATITGEFVENRIEESINSDAEIGSVDVSIFSFPARKTPPDKHRSSSGKSPYAPVCGLC